MIPHIAGEPLNDTPWKHGDFLEILSYYDGPRVVLQKDALGKLYIGWWNDEDDERERWVYVGVSPSRLRMILDGNVPSREAIENPEEGYVIVCDVDFGDEGAVRAVAANPASVPPSSLPLAGSRLDTAVDQEAGKGVQSATSRQVATGGDNSMYDAIYDLIHGDEFSVIESFVIPGRPAQRQSVPSAFFGSKVGEYINNWSAEFAPTDPALWKHQAQALAALGRGENVVVSSGTSSGKSMVFRAATLHKVLLNPSSKAVVFYPLRALVADQLRGWREMAHGLGLDENAIGQIDGSVPFDKREDVLRQARVIAMTPDVCQAWLMPRLAMPAVRQFIGSLSTLVMDEAHTLEGVFGSNFALLIRRVIAARDYLVRGDDSKSASLQLIAATATISNPSDHMKRLTGADFTVVGPESDGAPRYDRIVAHIASPEGEEFKVAQELQNRAVANGRHGAFITFLDSRKGVETLAMSTQRQLDDLLEDPAVVPYRSGFTSNERREIEARLRVGILKGVVSTSALELGIDFPSLRVGFNVGIPPTRKSYRQRLGRVGRNGPGAFVVIGPPNMFRRYGTSFQEYHDMSVEPSYLYLDNRFMQFAHGRCLADERDALAATSSLPTRVEWPNGFGNIYSSARPGGNRPAEFDAIAELGGDTPHRNYPLRNVGERNLDIKVHENADSLGDVTQSQALRECYPGATYFHMMRPYEVAAWHTTSFTPFIRVKSGAHRGSTRPRITTWINAGITSHDVIESHLLKSDSGFLAECQMQITERVGGYLLDRTGEFRSYQKLQQRNPNMKARLRNFRTSGVVLCVDKDWFKNGDVKRLVADELREVFAHEYSVLPQDVGSAATNISVRDSGGKVWRGGCVAVFDQTYGSLRLTERLYAEFEHILERLETVARSENGENDLESVIRRIRDEFREFQPTHPFDGAGYQTPTGYQQVFTKGSRVCHRQGGSIAVDVEIIQPTLMNGELKYQVKASSPRAWEPPMLHWIPASALEPSADADAWDYAWWNRETQVYENPPDEPESER